MDLLLPRALSSPCVLPPLRGWGSCWYATHGLRCGLLSSPLSGANKRPTAQAWDNLQPPCYNGPATGKMKGGAWPFQRERGTRDPRAGPLAVRMRPRTPEEFIGKGTSSDRQTPETHDRCRPPANAIFYGPPGTGKTSLAEVIAGRLSAAFEQMNAAMVGVKEVRECLERARNRLLTTKQKTVLFLDEVHRFNRAQQDVLLPDVEEASLCSWGDDREPVFRPERAAGVAEPDFQVRAVDRRRKS